MLQTSILVFKYKLQGNTRIIQCLPPKTRLQFIYLVWHYWIFLHGVKLTIECIILPNFIYSFLLCFFFFFKKEAQTSFYFTLPVFVGLGPLRKTNKQCKGERRQISYFIWSKLFLTVQRSRTHLESEFSRPDHSATTGSNYLLCDPEFFQCVESILRRM